MSDEVIVALFTSIPQTLVALATLIGVIVGIVKANKIHVLVNSNFSKVQSDLTIANQRIEALQTAIMNSNYPSPRPQA